MSGALIASGRRFVFVPLGLSGLTARTGRGVREDIAGQGDTFEGEEILSGPLCAQTPPEGIVLSEDVNISRVGCPGQTLRNEGTLAL
jgi:hypothetical protein